MHSLQGGPEEMLPLRDDLRIDQPKPLQTDMEDRQNRSQEAVVLEDTFRVICQVDFT